MMIEAIVAVLSMFTPIVFLLALALLAFAAITYLLAGKRLSDEKTRLERIAFLMAPAGAIGFAFVVIVLAAAAVSGAASFVQQTNGGLLR